ncbi:MAG: SpoIID/LytB domain-containing protein [Flavobacteriia bacterium]|nr:SpoIID/LytB domain-containing protein [Flavobacteriia bacterium]
MKCLILFLFGIIHLHFSQELRIGILRDYAIQRSVVSYNQGSYSLFGDTLLLDSLFEHQLFEFQTDENSILVKKGVQKIGYFNKVFLIANDSNSSFTIVSKIPQSKERKYKGNLEIFIQKSKLQVINVVDMDSYLAGVIESEGGAGRDIEYYKVQGVMCRTYALKNLQRHESEDFMLCDRVHCQAYHHMLRYSPKIQDAVNQTKGEILIDSDGHLAGTFFHANCGGQTSEAAYIWNKNLPYLNTFIDTFCIYTKQATWEKKILQQIWADFLVDKYNYPIYDSVYGPLIFSFNQSERQAFYHSSSLGIPLRDIRDQFDLKSTFFNCYPEGKYVVLRGRGVGHGVGLCQEGAMRMARFQFSYKQIALYYFPGLKFIQYDNFLKLKNQNKVEHLFE